MEMRMTTVIVRDPACTRTVRERGGAWKRVQEGEREREREKERRAAGETREGERDRQR